MAFAIRFYITSIVRLSKIKVTSSIPMLIRYLFMVLFFTNTVTSLTWVVILLRSTLSPKISDLLILVLFRASWFCNIIGLITFFLLINQLTSNRYIKLNPRQKFFCLIGIMLLILQLIIIIFFFSNEEHTINKVLFKGVAYYSLLISSDLILTSYRAIRSRRLPRILEAQIKTLVLHVVAPCAVLFVIQVISILTAFPQDINFIMKAVVLMFIIYAYNFCMQRLMRLRLLNATEQVELDYKSNFVKKYRKTFVNYQSKDIDQIRLDVKNFFKEELQIPSHKMAFYTRNLDLTTQSNREAIKLGLHEKQGTYFYIESKLAYLQNLLDQNKILVRDEIEYSLFYEENEKLSLFLDFLNAISADIFLPMYDKDTMIGYIVVERDARKRLYTASEQDGMVICAADLGKTIASLHADTMRSIMREQKKIQDDNYQKQQEINQHKESIQSFLPGQSDAIIFYKKKAFTYVNPEAEDLLGVDLNRDAGCKITQMLTRAAISTQEDKRHRKISIRNMKGERLEASVFSRRSGDSVILVIRRPEIADVITRNKLIMLENSDQWEYILYLDRTKLGQLINQFVPGFGQILLKFKINLLQACLSSKPALLTVHEEDLKACIDIIQHAGEHHQVHALKLTTPEKKRTYGEHTVNEYGFKLFGINPFVTGAIQYKPLLEKLTAIVGKPNLLFIENVDFLSLETQHALANYIRLGYFSPLKSDYKIASNVRIICSMRYDLRDLVRQDQFSPLLQQELMHTIVSMPPLIQLPLSELNDLLDGVLDQAIEKEELKSLLELDEKERARILERQPHSIPEFKECTANILKEKSNKRKLVEVTFDPNFAILDPELAHIARLGRRALQDGRIMNLLWDTFKSQVKIADFLGVNKSSVHRHFKHKSLPDVLFPNKNTS
jgi:hypothetical protein